MDLRPGPLPDLTPPRHAPRRPRRVVTRLLHAVVAVTGLALVGGLAGAPAASALTPAPISLSVSAGPSRGGTAVTITGERLTTASKVWFGSTAVTSITRYSSTRIRVTTPPHAAGTVYVKVTTADGTSAASARSTFAFDDVPTVTGLTPDSSPTPGGRVVTITGTGFERASSVRFGTTSATNLVRVSANTLRVTAPAHSSGPVDVRVTTPGGVSTAVPASRFTYDSPPALSALSVDAGPLRGGTVVTVTGERLGAATSVLFGSTPGTDLVRVSDTTLRVTAPAHSAGTVSVRVKNASGTSALTGAASFTYLAVPTVSSLSVQDGPVAGGTVVTIRGTGLARATAVTFDRSLGGDLTRVSDTTLRVTTPAHPVGTVAVKVGSAGGISVVGSGAAFTYHPVPVVTSVSPRVGPLRSGTLVTVTGSGFTRSSTVRVDGLAATVSYLSSTTLRVTLPAHGAGAVDVVVRTAGGASATGEGSTFEYVAVPVITALSDEAGPLAGGTVVTVTGSGLRHVTGLTFGTSKAPTVVVVSDTELRVTTPARPAGIVDVRVTTPGGTSAKGVTATFTYQPVPTVSSLSSRLSPSAGGAVVTVNGKAFERTTLVLFGDVPATTVVRVSSTQLKVTVPAHAEGVVDVRVTTPGGQSAVVLAGRFTFQDPPTVSALSPAAGGLAGGTVVTLSGTSLTDVTGVWFDGVPATAVKRLNAKTLVVSVPARAYTGPAAVRVTTVAGTTTRAGAWTYKAGSALLAGQVLSPGTAVTSPDGTAVAMMRYDGNLLVADKGVVQWQSGTFGPGNRLAVRADGNLVVLTPTGSVAWASGTGGFSGAGLALSNDGILVVRQGTTSVWDQRGRRYDRLLSGQVLRTGESLVSTNRAWVLTMRYDGNLLLATSRGRTWWSTSTKGAGNTAAVLSDGNVVVRSSTGAVLWSTRTNGRAGSFLRLLDNGNLAVYQRTTVAWAVTGGPPPDDWACYVYASQGCITRFGYVGQRVWNYPTDPWGNNCTNYSAFRLSKDGVANPGNLGNANTWDDNARAKGFRVDQSPSVGTIAQWNSNHVAYVDWVSADGNTVAISESSYGGTVLGMTFLSGSGRRILTRGSSSWPSNFIHFR